MLRKFKTLRTQGSLKIPAFIECTLNCGKVDSNSLNGSYTALRTILPTQVLINGIFGMWLFRCT